MKEREEKFTGQREKDDAMINFVSYQAQEAILNPNLPESYKDDILNAAIGTIVRIAERKNAYDVPRRYGRRTKKSHTIYEAK